MATGERQKFWGPQFTLDKQSCVTARHHHHTAQLSGEGDVTAKADREFNEKPLGWKAFFVLAKNRLLTVSRTIIHSNGN